jgi:hypothetical protein
MMKSFGLGILCAAVMAGAGACDTLGLGDRDGADGISFEVLRSAWERDDTIQVRLRNHTNRSLGYNLCFKVLERRMEGDWVPVQSMPENTACTTELRELQPGQEAFGGQFVFSFIPGGTYRFRTSVEWPLSDGNVTVTSNEFALAEQ